MAWERMRRLGRWWLPIGVAAVVAVLVTGALGARALYERTRWQASPVVALIGERETYGGLCLDGVCGERFGVISDGSWSYTGPDGTSRGTLDGEVLARVFQAADRTRLGQHGRGLVVDCAAAYDGESVRYRWWSDGAPHEADSCQVPIDADDPLVVILDGLAAQARAVAD